MSESAVKRLYAVGSKEVAVLAVWVVLQVELDLVSRPEVPEAVAADLREVDEDAAGSLLGVQAAPAFLDAPPLDRSNDSRQILAHGYKPPRSRIVQKIPNTISTARTPPASAAASEAFVANDHPC